MHESGHVQPLCSTAIKPGQPLTQSLLAQKEAVSDKKKQQASKPKRKVDREAATLNWETFIGRVAFYVIPMMDRMYLFRQAISRHQEWFYNVVEDEEDNDGLKIKLMTRLLRKNKQMAQPPTAPSTGFAGTRIIGDWVFGERLADSQSRQVPVCSFETCQHAEADIVHSGDASQRKAFRCKACNGRWARYLVSDLTDLSYLRETPKGTHILRYGQTHNLKTYYEVAQDKDYCRWTRRTYLRNLREGKPNTKMFTHFHTWLSMHQTMKDDYPSDTRGRCPEIYEEGWEVIGEELALFGDVEGPSQGEDEARSTATAVVAPVRRDNLEQAQEAVTSAASRAEHYRMDVDESSRMKGKGASPNAKKPRATGSRATGSTQASRDDLEEAKRHQLPPDSDDEVQGNKA